jgi:hypothetical protein
MPLTRDQYLKLTRTLRWANANGWRYGPWGHTWRNADWSVTFDPKLSALTVDRVQPGRTVIADRVRRAVVYNVTSLDEVLDVLSALGIPVHESEPVPDGHALDGPISFADAGQAFADLVDGRVTPCRAACVLSTLARQGLIVSTEYADEMASDLAVDRVGGGVDLGEVLTSRDYVPLHEAGRGA